jgi:hypothetical protein
MTGGLTQRRQTVYDRWKVVWHTEHAAGAFDTLYDNESNAERAGRQWVDDMRAIDPQGEDEYDYEIVAVADEYSIPDHRIEGTVGHFDRYVTGDR